MAEPPTWTDSLKQPKQQKMALKSETWNIRSLYMSGTLKTVPKELSKNKLHLEKYRWWH
jgi:hypothetical protein